MAAIFEIIFSLLALIVFMGLFFGLLVVWYEDSLKPIFRHYWEEWERFWK